MADIKKMIDDKYYMRSVIVHVKNKIEFGEEKLIFQIPNHYSTVNIDTNFRIINENDDDSENESDYDIDVERFGDDFPPNHICYYEDCIINILKYIISKYKDINIIKAMCFDHIKHDSNIKYQLTKTKEKCSNGLIYIATIGFICNTGDIFEFTHINHKISKYYIDKKVILARNDKHEFTMKLENFRNFNEFDKSDEESE